MADVIRSVFVKSSTTLEQCPKPSLPEFAFIGRSNVGKSSLINAITGRTKLAKVSGTPGKTRTINHFLINDLFYLADLPGYGYAKVSKRERKAFQGFTKTYLLERTNLSQIFVLIDIRIEAQKIDIEFINDLGQHGIPLALVFTKHDKVKPGSVTRRISEYQEVLQTFWEELPPYYITSSTTAYGMDRLLQHITAIAKQAFN